MKTSSKIAAALAASALVVTGIAAAPANAVDGTVSLATVLDVANPAFDSNPRDFDIVTAAVVAVLAAKPDSAVKVLADGNTALTAFVPTDGAFRKLARQMGKHGNQINTEAKVFAVVASLGIDNVEKVLLHHVVLSQVPSAAALKADGATLTSALGQTINVRVNNSIELRGSARPYFQPKVNLTQVDINTGNKQIAHAINAVLVPKL